MTILLFLYTVMKTNNTSEYAQDIEKIKRYGIPNYGDIKSCCHVMLVVHNYGFSVLYLVEWIYGIFIFVKYKKILSKLCIILVILSLLFVAEVCSAIFLLIDPYGFSGTFPSVILGLIWKVTDIMVVWNYFLLNLFMSRQTGLNISKLVFKNHNLTWACCVIETTIVLVCEILTSFKSMPRSISVISDSVIGVFAFILLSHFIYGAPRLSNYVRETKKARKSFNEFSFSKRVELCHSQSSISSKKRLQFPKIKTSENSLRKISFISYSDSSLNDGKVKRHGTSLIKRPTSLRLIPTIVIEKTNVQNKKVSVDDVDSTSGSVFSANHFDLSLQETVGSKIDNIQPDNSCEDKTFQLPVYIPKAKRFENTFRFSINSDDFDNVLQGDQGYLADSECISNVTDNSLKSDANSYSCVNMAPEEQNLKPTDVPLSVSFLSLYRVRQHKMLERMLKICYIQTFSLGIFIICKVYIIFSEYGGLFYTTDLPPVTWLIFQSLYRFMEVIVCFLYTVAVHVFTSSKPSRQLRRKRTTSTIAS